MGCKVKLNAAAVRKVFHSAGVKSQLMDKADDLKQKAENRIHCKNGRGNHYGTGMYDGEIASKAIVYTRTNHARNAEKKRGVLKSVL